MNTDSHGTGQPPATDPTPEPPPLESAGPILPEPSSEPPSAPSTGPTTGPSTGPTTGPSSGPSTGATPPSTEHPVAVPPFDPSTSPSAQDSSTEDPITEELPVVAAPTAGKDVPPPPPPVLSSPAMTAAPQSAGPGRSRTWIPLMGLAAILLAVFAISRLTGPADEPVAAPTTTTAPVVEVAVTSVPEDITMVNVLEPVADIAEAMGPAVVQIDTVTGLGSGVIYDADGLILTAAHVVDGVRQVTVRLSDGRSMTGEVLGTHAPTDIAVVKIDAEDLTVATLAVDEEIRVGSLAVAMGSPFGLDQSVTAGIVSAVDRSVSGVSMVQTDAAINPGNSGGPLVDARGHVIGINDQIFTNSGGNEGVGFAISIDLAKLVADQIVAGQEVQLAFLGVSSTTSVDNRAGALVQEVVTGSAAADAGIEVGDLIIAVNGGQVGSNQDLRGKIISTPPGENVTITVLRDGERVELEATLGSSS